MIPRFGHGMFLSGRSCSWLGLLLGLLWIAGVSPAAEDTVEDTDATKQICCNSTIGFSFRPRPESPLVSALYRMDIYDNLDGSEYITVASRVAALEQEFGNGFQPRQADPVLFRFRDYRFEKAWLGYSAWDYTDYAGLYTYPVPGATTPWENEWVKRSTIGCNFYDINFKVAVADSMDRPSLYLNNDSLLFDRARNTTYMTSYPLGNSLYPKTPDVILFPNYRGVRIFRFPSVHYESPYDFMTVFSPPPPLGPVQAQLVVDGYTTSTVTLDASLCQNDVWTSLLAPDGSDPTAPKPTDYPPPTLLTEPRKPFPFPPPPRYTEMAIEESLLGISYPIGYLEKSVNPDRARVLTAGDLIDPDPGDEVVEGAPRLRLVVESSAPAGGYARLGVYLEGGPPDLAAVNATLRFPATAMREDAVTTYTLALSPELTSAGFTALDYTFPRFDGSTELRFLAKGGVIDAEDSLLLAEVLVLIPAGLSPGDQIPVDIRTGVEDFAALSSLSDALGRPVVDDKCNGDPACRPEVEGAVITVGPRPAGWVVE